MTNIPQETAGLIQDILREIILTPKELTVQPTEMSRSFTIHISANFPDHKRIVGSMQAHFLAVTAIVKQIAQKHHWQADVARVEHKGRVFTDRYPDFVARNDWPKEKVLALVKRMGQAVFEYESDVQVNAVDGPAGSTNIDLLVSQAEDAQTVSEMLTAFKSLIRPVGKANGRTIYFNIVADIPHEAQPKTADGRHAKAITR